jgi:outer membrane protein
MRNLFLGSAAAALALAIPSVATAQQIPGAVVVVVDTERVYGECTACRAAQAQLQTQLQQLQARGAQLGQPLQAELQSLQAAAQAAQGQPDAALQQRAQAFQVQQESAQRELQGREEQLRRNQAFVVEQINQRMWPVVTQIMQQRGANLAVDRGSTLAINPALDVTDQVLAALNQQLPSVNVNAPAPAQQPAQQPQQPARPQGR